MSTSSLAIDTSLCADESRFRGKSVDASEEMTKRSTTETPVSVLPCELGTRDVNGNQLNVRRNLDTMFPELKPDVFVPQKLNPWYDFRFNRFWRFLKNEGWSYHRPSILSNTGYYLIPNYKYTRETAKMNVNCFPDANHVLRFVVKNRKEVPYCFLIRDYFDKIPYFRLDEMETEEFEEDYVTDRISGRQLILKRDPSLLQRKFSRSLFHHEKFVRTLKALQVVKSNTNGYEIAGGMNSKPVHLGYTWEGVIQRILDNVESSEYMADVLYLYFQFYPLIEDDITPEQIDPKKFMDIFTNRDKYSKFPLILGESSHRYNNDEFMKPEEWVEYALKNKNEHHTFAWVLRHYMRLYPLMPKANPSSSSSMSSTTAAKTKQEAANAESRKQVVNNLSRKRLQGGDNGDNSEVSNSSSPEADAVAGDSTCETQRKRARKSSINEDTNDCDIDQTKLFNFSWHRLREEGWNYFPGNALCAWCYAKPDVKSKAQGEADVNMFFGDTKLLQYVNKNRRDLVKEYQQRVKSEMQEAATTTIVISDDSKPALPSVPAKKGEPASFTFDRVSSVLRLHHSWNWYKGTGLDTFVFTFPEIKKRSDGEFGVNMWSDNMKDSMLQYVRSNKKLYRDVCRELEEEDNALTKLMEEEGMNTTNTSGDFKSSQEDEDEEEEDEMEVDDFETEEKEESSSSSSSSSENDDDEDQDEDVEGESDEDSHETDEAPIEVTFNQIWPILRQQYGWNWFKGNGLHTFVYALPEVQSKSEGELGKTMWGDNQKDEILAHVKMDKGLYQGCIDFLRSRNKKQTEEEKRDDENPATAMNTSTTSSSGNKKQQQKKGKNQNSVKNKNKQGPKFEALWPVLQYEFGWKKLTHKGTTYYTLPHVQNAAMGILNEDMWCDEAKIISYINTYVPHVNETFQKIVQSNENLRKRFPDCFPPSKDNDSFMYLPSVARIYQLLMKQGNKK